jgi:phage terminase small subunit
MSDKITIQEVDGILLTSGEQRFCVEYIKDLNPIRAVMRMGYDEIAAPHKAAEFMDALWVRKAIEQLIEQRNALEGIITKSPKDLGITDGYLIHRLKEISESSPKPEHQLRALELLGKSIGLFKENAKIELTDANGKKKSMFDPAQRKAMMEQLAMTKVLEFKDTP